MMQGPPNRITPLNSMWMPSPRFTPTKHESFEILTVMHNMPFKVRQAIHSCVACLFSLIPHFSLNWIFLEVVYEQNKNNAS